MSEIYATIAVLIIMILKEINIHTLRLIAPVLKGILVNHNEMLLFRLETIMDECSFSKQLSSKSVDVKRLFELRGYEPNFKRKGHLVAQTYKLKDNLVQM
jgi:hypothetical protein